MKLECFCENRSCLFRFSWWIWWNKFCIFEVIWYRKRVAVSNQQQLPFYIKLDIVGAPPPDSNGGSSTRHRRGGSRTEIHRQSCVMAVNCYESLGRQYGSLKETRYYTISVTGRCEYNNFLVYTCGTYILDNSKHMLKINLFTKCSLVIIIINCIILYTICLLSDLNLYYPYLNLSFTHFLIIITY